MKSVPSQVCEMSLTNNDQQPNTYDVSQLKSDDVKRKILKLSEDVLSSSSVNKAAIISSHTLYCDALAHCLNDEFDVMYGIFGTLNSFMSATRNKDSSGVMLIVMEAYFENTFEDMAMILNNLIDPSIVLIGDDDKYNQIYDIQQNIKAIIPVNSTLIVALQAIRLVQYGGVFFPRSCKAANNEKLANSCGENNILEGLTRTQLEVAEALRTGKSNKLIAHCLGMNEHTVKVHIRNILKRLGAANRTEAALIISRNRINTQNNAKR